MTSINFARQLVDCGLADQNSFFSVVTKSILNIDKLLGRYICDLSRDLGKKREILFIVKTSVVTNSNNVKDQALEIAQACLPEELCNCFLYPQNLQDKAYLLIGNTTGAIRTEIDNKFCLSILFCPSSVDLTELIFYQKVIPFLKSQVSVRLPSMALIE